MKASLDIDISEPVTFLLRNIVRGLQMRGLNDPWSIYLKQKTPPPLPPPRSLLLDSEEDMSFCSD